MLIRSINNLFLYNGKGSRNFAAFFYASRLTTLQPTFLVLLVNFV